MNKVYENQYVRTHKGAVVADEEGNALAWFADEANAAEWCDATNGAQTDYGRQYKVRLGDEL